MKRETDAPRPFQRTRLGPFGPALKLDIALDAVRCDGCDRLGEQSRLRSIERTRLSSFVRKRDPKGETEEMTEGRRVSNPQSPSTRRGESEGQRMGEMG